MRIPHRDDPREPWSDDEIGDLYQPTAIDPAWPEVDVTENPVRFELLGPDGEVIRQWRERPPFGFQPAPRRCTVKITLAMPYEGHQPDETIDVDDRTGRDLIRCGWAREPDPEPPKASKPAKAADADPAT